jgi:protein-S-isoprenylcysteine O-methyltransferase Ste14
MVMALAGLALGLGMRSLGLLEGPLGAAVMVAVVLCIALVGTVSYWRRLDEAAREAHKFAWYWGGSVGVAIALVLSVALAKANIDPLLIDLADGAGAGDLVGFGMLAAMGLQAACYFVAWAGWWISKR